MAVLDKPIGERALVVVPTFNERLTIAELARRLFEAAGDDVDLLVIDDASIDGTAEIVAELATGPHPIHLLERPGKLGLGTAYVTGFRWALRRGYGAVVEMDGDLSHDPADVVRLIEGLGDAELVIGSRYAPGGAIANWGLLRRVLSAGGNLYARLWLGGAISDYTSGFRAFRSSILRRLDLATVRSEGYAFQIETTRRVRRAGGRVAEVPIIFADRTQGRSKLSRAVVLEALVRVALWGLHDRLRRRDRDRSAGDASPGV